MAKTITNADVGARVRAARTKAGMSQRQMGEAIGVTDQAVGLYEKGARGLSVMMLYKIARATKVKPEELLP